MTLTFLLKYLLKGVVTSAVVNGQAVVVAVYGAAELRQQLIQGVSNNGYEYGGQTTATINAGGETAAVMTAGGE